MSKKDTSLLVEEDIKTIGGHMVNHPGLWLVVIVASALPACARPGASSPSAPSASLGEQSPWVEPTLPAASTLSSTGRSPYFVLEPGYQLVLTDDSDRLTITVLEETKTVDGVETRVVEERETKDGELVEVSR